MCNLQEPIDTKALQLQFLGVDQAKEEDVTVYVDILDGVIVGKGKILEGEFELVE